MTGDFPAAMPFLQPHPFSSAIVYDFMMQLIVNKSKKP